jgi:hypothetical protein
MRSRAALVYVGDQIGRLTESLNNLLPSAGRGYMANTKYGRLFTEEDVQRIVSTVMGIIGLALMRGETPPMTGQAMLEHALAVTAPSRLTFPADEPLFLLRGQDALAPDMVREYAIRADDPSAVNEEHRRAAWDAADEMREWQAQHSDRVKVPD